MDLGSLPPVRQDHMQSLTSHEAEWVRGVLAGAGLDSRQLSDIVRIEWGNLSLVYLIRSESEPSYIKMSRAAGSKGGFFIKPLGCVNQDEQEAGSIRRDLVRRLLSQIDGLVHRSITPQPLSFGPGLFEVWVSKSTGELQPERWIATRWSELKGDHLEPLKPDLKRHDPSSYSPAIIRQISLKLWELQKVAHATLTGDLRPLAHEQRQLLGYPRLISSLASAFGVSEQEIRSLEHSPMVQTLRQRADAKARAIESACHLLAQEVGLPAGVGIEKIAEKFLQRYPPQTATPLNIPITSHIDSLPFQEALFYAERDGHWPAESVQLGRRISQVMVAQDIVADILENEAMQTLELLSGVAQLEERYRRVEEMPMGIVHQDAHPLNFLVHEGELAILDPNEISWDVAFVDLSNVYAYKIVRAFEDRKIDEERCVELLQAALIPEWIGDHAVHIFDYCIAAFWNHAMALVDCYSLQPERAASINPAVTLATFSEGMAKREQYDRTYRERLYPLMVGHHSSCEQ